MKLNDIELKIGQWWGNGNALPWRVEDIYEPRGVFWYRHHDRTEINSESRRQIGNPPLRLLSASELDAAGIPDADRICEQQAWREGVELWDIPGAVRPEQIMELHIDGVCAGVTCDSSTTTDEDNKKHPSYSRNVTADPQYAEVWTRQHLADFVIAFRKTRDASVRYEAALPVLKWNLGDGWIYRVNNNRAEGWHPALKIWKPIVGSVDDGTRVILNCSDATASQIAASGCPLDDVPEPLRASVRKLREPGEAEAAPASESRPWDWHEGPDRGLARHKATGEVMRWARSRRHRDVISVYNRGGDSFRSPLYCICRIDSASLHTDYEQLDGSPCGIVESLAPRVDGKEKT